MNKFRYNELKNFSRQYQEFKRKKQKKNVDMIESAAREAAGHSMYKHILLSVTEGIPFEKLNARERIPCGKNYFYKIKKKYYEILDEKKD